MTQIDPNLSDINVWHSMPQDGEGPIPLLSGSRNYYSGTSRLGFLRQPDELRHDDSGIEHSEQGRE